MNTNPPIGPIDMSRPWLELNQQFRTAYWQAHPVQPRRPGAAAVIPLAAQQIYRQWTAAMLAHPGSPANRRD